MNQSAEVLHSNIFHFFTSEAQSKRRGSVLHEFKALVFGSAKAGALSLKLTQVTRLIADSNVLKW